MVRRDRPLHRKRRKVNPSNFAEGTMKLVQLARASLLVLTVAATPTLAADMPVKAGPASATAASFDWSGFYAGATAGYGWDRSQFCENGAECSDTYDIKGFAGGGTLGYNWQTGGWVFGLEGDISYASIDGSTPGNDSFGCGTECRTEVQWFATLRGRAGPTFDRLLLFVTGGLAVAHLEAGFVGSPFGSATRTGWTLGAGVEWAFAPDWSAKLEYLHIGGLGAFNADPIQDCLGGCFLPRSSFNVVRVGLNYRFATGDAPLATRY
jgi:outer membrane immunogenic protein